VNNRLMTECCRREQRNWPSRLPNSQALLLRHQVPNRFLGPIVGRRFCQILEVEVYVGPASIFCLAEVEVVGE